MKKKTSNKRHFRQAGSNVGSTGNSVDAGRRELAINKKVKNVKMLRANFATACSSKCTYRFYSKVCIG
jgi:hypothetical protein